MAAFRLESKRSLRMAELQAVSRLLEVVGMGRRTNNIRFYRHAGFEVVSGIRAMMRRGDRDKKFQKGRKTT